MCGITRREFRDYFSGARHAAAIRVGRSHRFDEPMSLDVLPNVKRPPQSFQYLASDDIDWLLQTDLAVATVR